MPKSGHFDIFPAWSSSAVVCTAYAQRMHSVSTAYLQRMCAMNTSNIRFTLKIRTSGIISMRGLTFSSQPRYHLPRGDTDMAEEWITVKDAAKIRKCSERNIIELRDHYKPGARHFS